MIKLQYVSDINEPLHVIARGCVYQTLAWVWMNGRETYTTLWLN